jgi:glucose/mannose-6-phosphate isomerase
VTRILPDGPIDTAGVRDGIMSLPDQLVEAGATGPVDDLPAPSAVDHVVIVAPGAARSAGEVVEVLARPVSTVPVLAYAGAVVPAYVTARSLVLVASVDDDPAAVSALRSAGDHGAAVVAVAARGSGLESEAEERGAARLTSPVDLPVARLAVGAVAVHILHLLEQLGQYADAESAVAAAAAQLGRRRDELAADDNPIARVSRRIGRTLPLFYGSDDLGGVAAGHCKRQVNLNAKAASFAGSLPGLGWDEVSGWGQHGDMTRQVFSLVTLRHDHESAAAEAAMAIVTELVEEVVHDRHELVAEGNGPLAQVLDLAFQGDVLSWHLAQELEIDPGPTAAVGTVSSAP